MRILFVALLLLCLLPHAMGETKPEIHINIPEFILRLYDNNQLIKEYPVALGTPYEQTPTGAYIIFYKEKYPTWIPGSGFDDKTPVPPGIANPLGSRWMEFKPAYGIHGTNKNWDIEYPVSGGCIRMYNADVEELYEIVDIGTPVIITYKVLFLTERDQAIYLTVLPDIYNQKLITRENVLELFKTYTNQYKLLPNWTLSSNSREKYERKIAVKKLPLH